MFSIQAAALLIGYGQRSVDMLLENAFLLICYGQRICVYVTGSGSADMLREEALCLCYGHGFVDMLRVTNLSKCYGQCYWQ